MPGFGSVAEAVFGDGGPDDIVREGGKRGGSKKGRGI